MMSKNQLIERFKALVAEHGNDWKTIAGILNQEGNATLRGKDWDANNARAFHRRLTSGREGSHQQKEKSVSRTLPEWLDEAASEDLQDMIQWWRERKGGLPSPRQQKPVFKGKRRNTGVHVNETILLRAMEKAKKDKVRTGGSLSLLVEWLLWRYLGEPEDVLEPYGAEK